MTDGREAKRSPFDRPTHVLRPHSAPQIEGQSFARITPIEPGEPAIGVEIVPPVPEDWGRSNLGIDAVVRLSEEVFGEDELTLEEEFELGMVAAPREIPQLEGNEDSIGLGKVVRRRRVDSRGYRSHDVLSDGSRVVLGASEKPKKRPDSHTGRSVQLGQEKGIEKQTTAKKGGRRGTFGDIKASGEKRREKPDKPRPTVRRERHINDHVEALLQVDPEE